MQTSHLEVPPAGPVRVEGHLDPTLSRWKWLVKWFLVIPHGVVLLFLWIAFVVLTIVAWVAILATGRYPHRLFVFNRGVVLWTWRVGFYACTALGTDRYPPFTLGPVPDYPATLEIDEPGRLSRGLALVKLVLAIPHLVIVGALTTGVSNGSNSAPGVLTWLVLVAAVGLLFTGRYPRGLFDLVMGINRWSFRVLAYVALMTDRYPPFRLDQGPSEPPAPAPLPPPRLPSQQAKGDDLVMR